MKISKFILCLILFICFSTVKAESQMWSKKESNNWYAKQGWVVGCNFVPSSAINQLEMWQSDTFDPKTIAKELGWAKDLGFNCMRVFLHSLAWQSDPVGFKKRINEYLAISSKLNIKTCFVFFDDCWNPEALVGKQPEPKPGVHNSGWIQDPIVSKRADTIALYKEMELYVKDILTTYKNDDRIIMWDLYNEPGNSEHFSSSLPLLKKVFQWAREVNPSQPLTSGIWRLDFYDLNKFQLENSDVITYHCYHNVERHQDWIHMMNAYRRPVICTEWMARRSESTFEKVMPMLKKQNIGAFNWGFVAGKSNTIFAWDDPCPDGKEPLLWFHDILRIDGTPYSLKEVEVIKSLTK
jgi:hypothetical protein